MLLSMMALIQPVVELIGLTILVISVAVAPLMVIAMVMRQLYWFGFGGDA